MDEYDCIVVDECHRGYLLDREMSDAELSFRDEDDYVSKYRRVLDHFDAVKIGLTATPALHTTEIFGAPVFTYCYREAVIDGWLVDHEPPIRIVTEARRGRHPLGGGREDVDVYDPSTQTARAVPRRRTRSTSRSTTSTAASSPRTSTASSARELARHIDPSADGKTLVFCATDEHADLVVAAAQGGASQRSTASVDDDAVAEDHRRRRPAARSSSAASRTSGCPSIAVTVDLLTTGIDVPADRATSSSCAA